ncbi:hypothetical protein BRC93_13270 [Halobacteriales archaeon QS_5_70_15]|nr:MAG: hypothetical protein BRC93_13270 [Halobacteriales archaeon QS_5_70_15]
MVEKGGFARLRSDGVTALHDRVVGIDPSIDGVVQRSVTDVGDCSLLHIEPGLVDGWVDDGLLLLGDAPTSPRRSAARGRDWRSPTPSRHSR